MQLSFHLQTTELKKLLFAIMEILQNKWSPFLCPVPGHIFVNNCPQPVAFIFEIFNHSWVLLSSDTSSWDSVKSLLKKETHKTSQQTDCDMSKRWWALKGWNAANTAPNPELSSLTNLPSLAWKEAWLGLKNPDFSQFCNAHGIQNSITDNHKKMNM